MPMFRSKFGFGTPPVLPRLSSSAERLVEACGIQNIDGAVDREPAPLEQCRVLHAFGWKNIISGGKRWKGRSRKVCTEPQRTGTSQRPCLHFNWRLSALIVQFHAAGVSSDANIQSLVPATIGSINSCLYLFGSARYQGNRIIRVIVCYRRDFPRVKISGT
ncbi:hypothetical protein PILCRDRAFT_296612 [Piloderma croceum F 1598]|uniref:Uncharacterized protein n=1 Tax=Piloderma croceum (strain F 1598) TaxID=765440 RepID=A0A0C3CBG7_PILCF|nr:hypothetical protein PILCRDRAFT_296612 [Piloderma croceum F 1598]